MSFLLIAAPPFLAVGFENSDNNMFWCARWSESPKPWFYPAGETVPEYVHGVYLYSRNSHSASYAAKRVEVTTVWDATKLHQMRLEWPDLEIFLHVGDRVIHYSNEGPVTVHEFSAGQRIWRYDLAPDVEAILADHVKDGHVMHYHALHKHLWDDTELVLSTIEI